MSLPKSPRCVITGAGGGFGRALAIELAGRGAHLVLSDVDVAGRRRERPARPARGRPDARAHALRRHEDRRREGARRVVRGPGRSRRQQRGREQRRPRWASCHRGLALDARGRSLRRHQRVPRLRPHPALAGSRARAQRRLRAGLLSPPSMGAYNVAKAGVIALSETLNAELVGHQGQGDRPLPDILPDEHRQERADRRTRRSARRSRGS